MVLRLVLTTGKTCENFKMGPVLKYLFKSIDEEGRERPTLDGTGVGTMPVSRGATVGDEAARSLMGRPFAGAMPVVATTEYAVDGTTSDDARVGTSETPTMAPPVGQLSRRGGEVNRSFDLNWWRFGAT